jgi:hypothetical protein
LLDDDLGEVVILEIKLESPQIWLLFNIRA